VRFGVFARQQALPTYPDNSLAPHPGSILGDAPATGALTLQKYIAMKYPTFSTKHLTNTTRLFILTHHQRTASLTIGNSKHNQETPRQRSIHFSPVLPMYPRARDLFSINVDSDMIRTLPASRPRSEKQ
jgi:hypothetical protein